MSEEIAEYKSNDVTANETGGLTPNSFDGLWRMSQIMSKSGLMPKGIEKPEAVFVAVAMGLELGLSPMQSVQSISPINNQPTIWGDAMLGLVRASGVLEEFRETSVGTFPNDNYAAVCTVKRKAFDTASQTFTIADAKKASLWGKSGPWSQYPKRMLQMRARSWALRDGFGDVLKGLRCAEEVRDYDVNMGETRAGAYEPMTEATPKPESAPDPAPGPTVPESNSEPGPEPGPETTTGVEEFAHLVINRGYDPRQVKLFVEATAKANNKTIEEVKKQALTHQDRFFASYEKFTNDNGESDKNDGNTPDPGPDSEPESEATFREEWINLRAPGYSTFVWTNLERIRASSAELQQEAREKWEKFYSAASFPLDQEDEEQQQDEQRGNGQPETETPVRDHLPWDAG